MVIVQNHTVVWAHWVVTRGFWVLIMCTRASFTATEQNELAAVMQSHLN